MTCDSIPASPVEILHRSGCSLVVIDRHGTSHTYRSRGVADLYGLITSGSGVLAGADVADKVVGKGAAALMVLGCIRSLHADVISRPALAMLSEASIKVDYTTLVDGIINRAGTGPCPVETLCLPLSRPEDCLNAISGFLNSVKLQSN